MKKIRVVLVALIRSEYTETIEVPDETTHQELDDLVTKRYDEVDKGEFIEDNEYLEKGGCYWEEEQPTPHESDPCHT